jgi:hypothetical protein
LLANDYPHENPPTTRQSSPFRRHRLAGTGQSPASERGVGEITPGLRALPDVLEVRLGIYANAKKWERCVDIAEAIIKLDPDRPNAWIQCSFALHELKLTQQALDQWLPVADTFPKAWMMPYNLACYCAQLGRLATASNAESLSAP